MKAIRFRCPKCRTPHSADADAAGQVVVCSSCFGPVIVPKLVAGPTAPLPVGASPEPARRPRVALLATLGAGAAVAVAVGLVGLRAGRVPAKSEATPPPAPAVQATPKVEPAPTPPPVVVAEAPRPAAEPAPPVILVTTSTDPDRPLVIRRRQALGQDALRRQLAGLPELVVEDRTEITMLALHQVLPPSQGQGGPKLSAQDRERLRKIAAEERGRRRVPVAQQVDASAPARPTMRVSRAEPAPRDMLAMLAQVQPELSPLPWRMGDDCHLDREAAEDLQVLSRALRNLLVQATPQGDNRPDAALLRAALLDDGPAEETSEAQAQALLQAPAGNNKKAKFRARFVVPAAIPALGQLLMAERTPARLVLADVLARIPGKEATVALARLACFDLAPEVRERATLALRARPAEDYRPTLLEGLRYPWAPVADHAAEALVALVDREAVPALEKLVNQPDPERPRFELRDGKAVRLARTLVQVNHLQNCVLCHAPSANANLDMVRGRVPDESQPLPPPVEYYANSSPGLFVRADVTYLRQDFSVTQPVDEPGPWPAHQRFDYLVTERPTAAPDAVDRRKDYPQRQSVLFALRELTGKDRAE